MRRRIPSIMEAPTAWRSIKGCLDALADDDAVMPSTLAVAPLGPPTTAGLAPTTGRSPSPSAAAAGDPGAAIAALEDPVHALGTRVVRSGSGSGEERIDLPKRRGGGLKLLMQIKERRAASKC